MRIRSVRESSWKGELVVTRECSKCGWTVNDEKSYFCHRCGHKFNQRPTRIETSKAAVIIEAHYAAKEGK